MVPKLLLANFCIESIPVNKENLASSGRTQVLAQPLGPTLGKNPVFFFGSVPNTDVFLQDIATAYVNLAIVTPFAIYASTKVLLDFKSVPFFSILVLKLNMLRKLLSHLLIKPLSMLQASVRHNMLSASLTLDWEEQKCCLDWFLVNR